MKHLFLITMVTANVYSMNTKIVSISPDKYSFKTSFVTAILASDIEQAKQEQSNDEEENEEELSNKDNINEN